MRFYKIYVNNTEGYRLVRASEIQDLSPEVIRVRLGLPVVPDRIQTVIVPAGTQMNFGQIGAQSKFPNPTPASGAMQYQILDALQPNWFKAPISIK